MGFSLSKVAGKISKGVGSVAQAVGAVGSLPVQAAAQSITQTAPALVGAVGAAGQVAGSATQVLQQNPALAGALAPALSGWGLGSLIPQGAMASAPAPSGPVFMPAPEAPSASVPVWVWIVGGVGALLAVVLFLRK
jgi:hypothetical protein